MSRSWLSFTRNAPLWMLIEVTREDEWGASEGKLIATAEDQTLSCWDLIYRVVIGIWLRSMGGVETGEAIVPSVVGSIF
jgi:hypothetical protein